MQFLKAKEFLKQNIIQRKTSYNENIEIVLLRYGGTLASKDLQKQ